MNTGIILARRTGISPLEFLLNVMDDIGNDLHVRLDAAKSAAPYCHHRLAQLQIEVQGEVLITKVERSIVHVKDTNGISLPTPQ